MKPFALVVALGLLLGAPAAPAVACSQPLDPNVFDAKATLNEAYFLDRQGEYAQAVKLYKKVLEVQPDNRKAYYLMANTYWRDNQLDDARKAWETVLRMDTSDRWAREARAWLKETHVRAQGDKVVTIAFKDGGKLKSRFMQPTSMVVTPSGVMYVADVGAHRILRIGADGELGVVGGNGKPGQVDGNNALAAMVNWPKSLAVDPIGNLYFIDGNRVRFVTPTNRLGTLAGWEEGESRDGDYKTARLYRPTALTTDAKGNVYVAEGKVPAIRMISPNGDVRLVAGGSAKGRADGAGAEAQFGEIAALRLTPGGELLVADAGNNLIRRISREGQVSTLTGCDKQGLLDGPLAMAHFKQVLGLLMDDAGNTYVADAGNFAVRRITAKGKVETLAGGDGAGEVDGVGILASFGQPADLALADGELYVLDRANRSVRKLALR